MSYAYPQGGGGAPYGQQGFYNSNFSAQPPVSGSTTPYQAYGGTPSSSGFAGFSNQHDLSGNMGQSGTGLTTGWLAAFGTEGYPGEPPLMEELGINFGHIRQKTVAVLNPFGRIDQHMYDDSDLAGPIIFFLLFGFFLLASGRIHFGYIYGIALVGCFALHTILSLMAPPLTPEEAQQAGQPGHPGGSRHFSSSLTLARSGSILGYCLIPLVMVSLLGIAIPMDSIFGYIITTSAIAFSSYSASSMFCAVGRMTSMKLLVLYPLVLFYSGFGIMAIFSSRGSGALQAKTTGG